MATWHISITKTLLADKTGYDAEAADGKDTPRMKENQNIEWKESWRDKYIKWICGVANAAGGILVVGENNNGSALDAFLLKKHGLHWDSVSV